MYHTFKLSFRERVFTGAPNGKLLEKDLKTATKHE